MISQNHIETTPRLNIRNPQHWKQKGQPSFIERHSVNIQKALEAKEKQRKMNKSFDFTQQQYQNSQSSYFIQSNNLQIQQQSQSYEKNDNYYLPKCLREQNLSNTANIKNSMDGLYITQNNNNLNDSFLPQIQPNSYKNHSNSNKQNISLLGLNKEQRKKILSIDLTKLHQQNIKNNINNNDKSLIQNDSLLGNHDVDHIDSPNTTWNKTNNNNNYQSNNIGYDGNNSSGRVRESLFLLPKEQIITKQQRQILLDDLENAYFLFKKEQRKQRFFSSKNRTAIQIIEEKNRNTRKLKEIKKQLQQNNNNHNLSNNNNNMIDIDDQNYGSVININEANDLMEDRTIDSNRIDHIMNIPEPKIKSKRKLSNEIREENGIKYPLKLHMMNQYRKNRIEEIIKFKGHIDTNLRHPDDELQMDLIWKKMPEYQKVIDEEKEKRSKEIKSRKAQHTPIYDVLSLNKQQKKRVISQFQGVIPVESRFYDAVTSNNNTHNSQQHNQKNHLTFEKIQNQNIHR